MSPSEPHICTACREPFVVPVSLLGMVRERFLVALHCSNCATLSMGVHDESELEKLDRELDRAVASIAATAEALRTGVMG
jgi:hypothetical protein